VSKRPPSGCGDALFADTDHRRPASDEWQGGIDHRAALVQHDPRGDSPVPERIGDGAGGAAVTLFVAAEGEVHITRGHEVLGQEALDGVEKDHHRPLVIERVPPEDPAILDHAIERR
jgi:hypothetical protein